MPVADFVPLASWREKSVEEMRADARDFLETMRARRTVREFSDRPVPRDVIEDCLLAAGHCTQRRKPTAVEVRRGRRCRREARRSAPRPRSRSSAFYNGKAPQEWLDALEHLGTDEHKPFLERAPWLIVIFAESYELHGRRDEGEELLRDRVGGDRDRYADHGAAPRRARDPDTHTVPDEVSERLARAPGQRAPFPDPGRRVSRRGCAAYRTITKKPIEEIAVFVE